MDMTSHSVNEMIPVDNGVRRDDLAQCIKGGELSQLVEFTEHRPVDLLGLLG